MPLVAWADTEVPDVRLVGMTVTAISSHTTQCTTAPSSMLRMPHIGAYIGAEVKGGAQEKHLGAVRGVGVDAMCSFRK